MVLNGIPPAEKMVFFSLVLNVSVLQEVLRSLSLLGTAAQQQLIPLAMKFVSDAEHKLFSPKRMLSTITS